MFCFSFGEQFAAGGAADFVGEADHARAGAGDPGGGEDFVVVAGRAEVAAADPDDDEVQAAALLHFAVADALHAAELGAGDFHPDEVVGVVDDPHLVGFGVTDAEAHFGAPGRVCGHRFFMVAEEGVLGWP